MERSIATLQLQNGTYLSTCAIEIVSIPDVSITSYTSETDVQSAYAADLTRTMSSIFSISKAYSGHENSNVAVELLWAATPVEHQTYAAKIRLIYYLRGVAATQPQAMQLVEQVADALTIMLEIDRFSFRTVEQKELATLLKTVSFESRQAILRVVRNEKLPIPAMPSCMHFDCFSPTTPPLESMVNALIKSPNTLVSFQLTPVALSSGEKSGIESVCQTLSMLSSGLHDPAFGMIPVVAARKCNDTYNYYHSNSDKAMFAFNVSVYGPSRSAGLLVFAVQSVLSGAGQTALTTYSLRDVNPEVIINNYASNPWMLSQYLQSRYPATGASFDRMPYIVSAEEAVAMFSLPVGGSKVSAGFTVDYSQKQGREYRAAMVDAGELTIGFLKSSAGGHTFGIAKNDLTKHMLIVGTPGSGKTTFSVGMLDRLWKQGVPFLVIEPAKNEYRALIRSIPDLQVFTPGKNTISPFVFNPFVPPENVRLESYKPTLKTAFAAGVSMTTPLDKIFEETINNCYANFGWLDTYTTADSGKVFSIADFIQCFQRTFEEIGYTGEVSNIGKAGVVRLKGLQNLFDNYFSIPIGDLLKKPTVIELAAIENSDEKALIIALLLLSILSYVNANFSGDSGLRNIILLEEAHVLLDSQSNAADGDANPSAIAQGLVKRMLAELRSYGIGLVIADQSPRKVTTDVVALTDVKLTFRLVESVDKQIIADSTNMTAQQASRLSRLKPGEAFFFFNKLEEPEEVVTENYRLENKIDITLSDAEIARLSTYWKKRPESLRPYPECCYSPHCQKSCTYFRRILAKEIARRIFVNYIKPEIQRLRIQAKRSGDTTPDIAAIEHDAVGKVFAKIVTIARHEANGETITPELLTCIKVHLFRRIRYETRLRLPMETIRNSLQKK